MNIAVFSLCWNEEAILPFFLRHYAKFSRRITLFDNQSNDRSSEIVAEFKRQRRDVRIDFQSFNSDGQLRDDIHVRLKNSVWKECRGTGVDWVVICDMDEFVYHPNILTKLRDLKRQHYTTVLCAGYDMIASDFPKEIQRSELTDLVYRGRFSERYSKCAVFNPEQILEIAYSPGAHVCAPRGNVRVFRDRSIKLLHYKALGFDHMFARIQLCKSRLSEINRRNGWGIEYDDDESVHRRWFEALNREATDVLRSKKPMRTDTGWLRNAGFGNLT